MALPVTEHVTSKERAMSTIAVIATYLVFAFTASANNIWLYIFACLILILALTKVQKHFLLYLNERRSKALEVKPEVSPDDDSDVS